MGLYENENVLFYDPVTGEETTDAYQQREQAEVDEFISQSQKLEGLKKSKGWKILTTYLDETISLYKELLVNETDTAKIVRLQEAVKCYRNVQAFVDLRVNEGKEFLDRKRTLERGQSKE